MKRFVTLATFNKSIADRVNLLIIDPFPIPVANPNEMPANKILAT